MHAYAHTVVVVAESFPQMCCCILFISFLIGLGVKNAPAVADGALLYCSVLYFSLSRFLTAASFCLFVSVAKQRAYVTKAGQGTPMSST